jgi:hypothetical protein
MDELVKFKDWWTKTRPFVVPYNHCVVFDNNIRGAVLYRAECWQVQLFILDPNTVIPEHQHPNVDSFELYLGGDIEFTIDGKCFTPRDAGPSAKGTSEFFAQFIRVTPTTWHGASSGPQGGSFISIQQWLNEVKPTNVGDDWMFQPNQDKRNYANT